MSEKETFLPVLKDQCCDQGCDDHDERHSDCDDLVNCQTCRGRKEVRDVNGGIKRKKTFFFFFLSLLSDGCTLRSSSVSCTPTLPTHSGR